MANDSGLFRQPHEPRCPWLSTAGPMKARRSIFRSTKRSCSGILIDRFSTYRDATQAQLNMQTLPRLVGSQHDDPNNEPLARYWIARPKVAEALAGKWNRGWLLGWRDITGIEKVRTFVPSVLPTSAVGNKFLLAFPEDPAHGPLLHAVWSTMAFDYVARQKISGTADDVLHRQADRLPGPRAFAHADQLAVRLAPSQNGLSPTYWNCRTRRGGFSPTPGRWATTVRHSDGILTDVHFCGLTWMPRCFTSTVSLESRPNTFSTRFPSCASTMSETMVSTEHDALSSRPMTE